MAYTLSTFGGSAVLDKVAKTVTVTGYSIPDGAINKINGILDWTAGLLLTQANSPTKGIVSIVSNVITLELDTNVAAYANTDIIDIFVNDIIGEDPTTDTKKVTVSNPANTQYITPIFLQDTTNIAAATNYYPDSTGFLYQGLNNLQFQIKLVDATLTLEMTNSTLATPIDWTDATEYLDVIAGDATYRTDTSSYTSFNNCTIVLGLSKLAGYKFRFKVITPDNTNTVAISMVGSWF